MEHESMQIKKIIIDNLQILINHQFGNQVIQTAIQYWNDENVEIILKLIQNNYAALSMGKYSSNVIEKCIEKKEEILDKELYENFRELDLKEKEFINVMIDYMKKNG